MTLFNIYMAFLLPFTLLILFDFGYYFWFFYGVYSSTVLTIYLIRETNNCDYNSPLRQLLNFYDQRT